MMRVMYCGEAPLAAKNTTTLISARPRLKSFRDTLNYQIKYKKQMIEQCSFGRSYSDTTENYRIMVYLLSVFQVMRFSSSGFEIILDSEQIILPTYYILFPISGGKWNCGGNI